MLYLIFVLSYILFSELQKIILIALDKTTWREWKGSGIVDWRGRISTVLGSGGGDRTQEQYVRVAGDTPDIETRQLLNLKRFLRPIAFCNYKCRNKGLLPNSAVCFLMFVIKRNEFLHADGSHYSSINWFSGNF